MTEKKQVPDIYFLIVDDDAMVRTTVADYLRTYGYKTIFEAADGAKAIDVLKNNKIDFIISDWEMPGVSGLELLKVLRTHKKYMKIPFLMMTSPTSHEHFKVANAAAAHVSAYIIKPFRSQILKDKIDSILKERSEGQKAILVVDDDDNARDTIVEYLKNLGYDNIFQATNGTDGLNLLRTHVDKVMLVVSDWEMPGMAGIELLRQMKEDATLREIPFIMITSQTSIEHMKLKQAIESRVDHYLLKPVRGDDLSRKVQTVLERSKIEDQMKKKLQQGQKILAEGNWADAEKLFHQVLLHDPQNVDAYLGLGMTHANMTPKKDLEKAIQYLRNAIDLNPRYEEGYIQLALTFEGAMSLDKAISCLREGLMECTLSERLHFHMGRVLLRRGLVAEAIFQLEKAVELKSDFHEAVDLLNAARRATSGS